MGHIKRLRRRREREKKLQKRRVADALKRKSGQPETGAKKQAAKDKAAEGKTGQPETDKKKRAGKPHEKVVKEVVVKPETSTEEQEVTLLAPNAES